MAGYTKLFADIVTSTIWQSPNDCRVLWISILALKGKDNICRATIPALAKMCDITVESCEEYLGQFQAPDKYSRSQEHEGRRIQAVDGGYLVLNGEKYQNLLRQDERKEYVRQKVAEHRARKRAVKSVTGSKHVSSSSPAPDTSPSPPVNTDARAQDDDLIGQAPRETGTPVGVGALAPADLSAPLRQIWVDIAVDHGHEVATRARDATKRLFGACTPARMRETFSAAYERHALHLPADQWPDFRTAIRAERAGLNGAPTGPIDPERAAARKAYEERRAKENNHVAR